MNKIAVIFKFVFFYCLGSNTIPTDPPTTPVPPKGKIADSNDENIMKEHKKMNDILTVVSTHTRV